MALQPTIGLEVHVQLNTKSKIFCSCATSFGAEANENTCPVCLALPGALPVFNELVLEKAIMAAFALNCEVHLNHRFDRKNYFYPDLPKAYQISQFNLPYCTNGHLTITKEDGTSKRIGITRIHMEEDAGKLVHSETGARDASYVDLNRAGTPLIEIVSEPEISDSEEAYLYLNKLKNIMEYINVSDCNMEQGSLRCDANVSVAAIGATKLGTRAEVKNLNSFKGVRAAIEHEIERQTDLIETGGQVVQETRLYNADLDQTFSMRGKEEAHDYRYFADPDLVPFEMSEEVITKIKNSLPELGEDRKIRFKEDYGLNDYDADVLTAERSIAEYFESAVKSGANAKKASNWIQSEMLAITKEKNCQLNELFSSKYLADLINEIESGRISGKIGKTVIQEMITSQKGPLEIIKAKGLIQISDEDEIIKIINKVMIANPDSVTSFKEGKKKALGFLVGQVMKESKGKANPQLVNKLLGEKLNS